MQLTSEVRWSIGDFVVMGVLLFGFGSGYVLVSRKLSTYQNILVGIVFLIGFLYLWGELAVGIFTKIGS